MDEKAVLLQLLCKGQTGDHYLPHLPTLQASAFYITAYIIQYARESVFLQPDQVSVPTTARCVGKGQGTRSVS